jgi:hypothetical protein
MGYPTRWGHHPMLRPDGKAKDWTDSEGWSRCGSYPYMAFANCVVFNPDKKRMNLPWRLSLEVGKTCRSPMALPPKSHWVPKEFAINSGKHTISGHTHFIFIFKSDYIHIISISYPTNCMVGLVHELGSLHVIDLEDIACDKSLTPPARALGIQGRPRESRLTWLVARIISILSASFISFHPLFEMNNKRFMSCQWEKLFWNVETTKPLDFSDVHLWHGRWSHMVPQIFGGSGFSRLRSV